MFKSGGEREREKKNIYIYMGEQKLVYKFKIQFSNECVRDRERKMGDRERGGMVMKMLFNDMLIFFLGRLSALLHFTMWIGFYL